MEAARIAAALERAIAAELPPALPGQRWFGAKGRAITGARLRDGAELGEHAWLALVDVTFAEGPDESYAIPLVLGADASAGPSTLSLTLELDGARVRATDAFDHPGFLEADFGTALVRGFAQNCQDCCRGRDDHC